MRYLMLIYGPEPAPDEVVPEEIMQGEQSRYAAFTKDVRERSIMEAGEALEPTATATTVRVRDGQTLVTDGPFAETKEALGGFYLLSCRDLDEAVELAARIPAVERGSIEIRPIWELPADYGSDGGREAVGSAG
jgi:hypothetical protein